MPTTRMEQIEQPAALSTEEVQVPRNSSHWLSPHRDVFLERKRDAGIHDYASLWEACETKIVLPSNNRHVIFT